MTHTYTLGCTCDGCEQRSAEREVEVPDGVGADDFDALFDLEVEDADYATFVCDECAMKIAAVDAEQARYERECDERWADVDGLTVAERAWLTLLIDCALDHDGDPVAERRDEVVREELSAGGRVTYISGLASVYITRRDGTRVRVSDHKLPMSDERRYSRESGHAKAWDVDLTEV